MIRVSLGARSYRIVTGRSYGSLPALLRPLGLSGRGVVVSHRHLLRRHGRALLGPLRRAGWTLDTFVVPAAETSKSLAMLARLLAHLSRRAPMRPPVLFAFGGGVVGDLTGFAAAVYRRGVPYVQLPTTLLAQVDSAIGGKVGIDLPQAKNFVGCFYQPRVVYNHVGLLAGLPMRQRRSGLAEVIKYGVIADPALFRFVEARLGECLALGPQAVRVMVERSCAIKAAIVSRDERETRGLRAQLNFGHTLGHALEAASAYRRWTHGEAIAIGMCAAAQLAVELGRLAPSVAERLRRLIRRAGLPTHAGGVAAQRVFQALAYDKKFLRGRPRWVLPVHLGRVVVTERVPEALMRRVIRRVLLARQ